MAVTSVLSAPSVNILLKEELKRFYCELDFVRASLDSESLAHKHTFSFDTELSSDGSDCEDNHSDHGIEPRRSGTSRVVFAVGEKIRDKVFQAMPAPRLPESTNECTPKDQDVNAPNEPPTRQRSIQGLGSTPASSVGIQLHHAEDTSAMLSSRTWGDLQQIAASSAAAPVQNHNPNHTGPSRQSTEPALDGAQIADASLQEVVRGESLGADGPAEAMASKIQQLLEGRRSSLDWTAILSTSYRVAPAPLPGPQEPEDWPPAMPMPDPSCQALTTKASLQASKTFVGSEEAQAYLARVLAALVPALRLEAVTTAKGPSNQASPESADHLIEQGKVAPKNAGGLEGGHEEGNWSTSPTRDDPRHRGQPLNARDEHLLLHDRGEQSIPLSGEQTEVLVRPTGVLVSMDETLQFTPTRIDGISDPAPRSKLTLLPSVRGAAVKKPALVVQTPRALQGLIPPGPVAASSAEVPAEGSKGDKGVGVAAGSAKGSSVEATEAPASPRPFAGVVGHLSQTPPTAASKLPLNEEVRIQTANSDLSGTPGGVKDQVLDTALPRASENVRSDMEDRVRVLELLQRRTLELQEQKLQHEIDMQKKRAELQLQSHSLEASSLAEQEAGVRAPLGVAGPLKPAALLLTQAREAAQEVNEAVATLQTAVLPTVQARPGESSDSSALSHELATAVSDLKEMLDKKLGEFYSACASFHAASLQVAAQVAQAAQSDVNTPEGERSAAAAHAMARQTAELDGLRQQVRGSHQLALQSPAFRLPPDSRTPIPTKPPSRARSRSSTASQASKRGPHDVASAAAELASGLRQLPSGNEPTLSQWPGLDSAVEEAVKVAEGHGLERQLLQHAAHARWRELAAREEERANSAKAAVQALLGSAFDYEAARKELDLIARAAEGVPERAKERARDPAFQALAYASATQKHVEDWEAASAARLTAQQDEEALFLEKLRQDVDRRIAAAAALSTGMNVGAKRRRVGDPLAESLTNRAGRVGQLFEEPSKVVRKGLGNAADWTNEQPGKGPMEPAKQPIVRKENVASGGDQRARSPQKSSRPRELRKQEQKPVSLKKVEVAFGHKVDTPKPPQTHPARKRKESGDDGWVKRMSAPRRPAQSPGGMDLEGARQERGPRAGVPRRSTLRPAELVHRPVTAVRWPSPEPRRPKSGEAAVEVRPVGAAHAVWESDDPVGRLMALAREAAAGVSEFADRLSEPAEQHETTHFLMEQRTEGREAESGGAFEGPGLGGRQGTILRAEEGSEGTAKAITDWLSEQVVATLLRQPQVLDGLAASKFGPSSVRSGGTDPGESQAIGARRNDDVSRRPATSSDDISIDEELVRALAAEVVEEEVERLFGEKPLVEGGSRKAGQESTREEGAVGSASEGGLERAVSIGEGGAGRMEKDARDESVASPGPDGHLEEKAGTPSAGHEARPLLRAAKDDGVKGHVDSGPRQQPGADKRAESLEPSQSQASSLVHASSGGMQPPPPLVAAHSTPPASHFQIPPFVQQSGGLDLGMQPMLRPSPPWPFMPLPLFVLPDGRVVQIPFPNPVPDAAPAARHVAAAQTEPQISPQPKPVKLRLKKKNAGSPATPPTPSTPSSSPEVTLVSRRKVRRGFEAALEGMGIGVRLDVESDTGIRARRMIELAEGSGSGTRADVEPVSEQQTGPLDQLDQANDGDVKEATNPESKDQGVSKTEGGLGGTEIGLSSSPPEDQKPLASAPLGQVPAEGSGTDRPRSSQEGLPPPQEATGDPSNTGEDAYLAPEAGATSAAGAENSPGRTRRRWAFLDARWDARLAVDTLATSLLLEGAEETSSRSGGGSTSNRSRGSATGLESTSMSFGEVVADLASEPSTTFEGRPSQPQAEAPHDTLSEFGATSSLSEGEAEAGDLRHDQEPGQRGRVVLPGLSTDSEPGFIRQSSQSERALQSKALRRTDSEQEEVDTSSASIEVEFVRRRQEGAASKGGSRVRPRRPTPKRGVVSNAVATLRSLAKAKAANDASEGERESGAEEGEMGWGAKEAGQRY